MEEVTRGLLGWRAGRLKGRRRARSGGPDQLTAFSLPPPVEDVGDVGVGDGDPKTPQCPIVVDDQDWQADPTVGTAQGGAAARSFLREEDGGAQAADGVVDLGLEPLFLGGEADHPGTL